MKTILLSLAFLAAFSFAHNGGGGNYRMKSDFSSFNEAVESGECYVACENGEAFLYKGKEKIDFSSCLEIRKHRGFNCSDSERSKFNLKMQEHFDKVNKRQHRR